MKQSQKFRLACNQNCVCVRVCVCARVHLFRITQMMPVDGGAAVTRLTRPGHQDGLGAQSTETEIAEDAAMQIV